MFADSYSKLSVLLLAALLPGCGGAVSSAELEQEGGEISAQSCSTLHWESNVRELGSDSRDCLRAQLAANGVYATGRVLAGPPVQFTLHRSPGGTCAEGSFTRYHPAVPTSAYSYAPPLFEKVSRPADFPGAFRICAKNFGSARSTVEMSLNTW